MKIGPNTMGSTDGAVPMSNPAPPVPPAQSAAVPVAPSSSSAPTTPTTPSGKFIEQINYGEIEEGEVRNTCICTVLYTKMAV